MVDTDRKRETDLGGKLTAPAGTPSTPVQATPDPIAEAQILEETITRAGPKPPAPPTRPVSPMPKVEVPTPPVTSPKPIAPSAPLNPMPPKPAALDTDIAKILEGVKLPERRNSEKPAGAEAISLQPVQEETPSPPAATPMERIMTTPRSAEEKQRDSVSAVHTLKNDLQNVVRDQKVSVVRAVSLEEDRRARATKEPEEAPAAQRRSKRTFAIIFTVVLLSLLGVGAVFAVYAIMGKRAIAPPPEMDASILFAEQSVVLPLSHSSPGDVKRALAEGRMSSAGTLGSIARIIPTLTITNPDNTEEEVPASFAQFMRGIGATPPDELIRALGNDFFFGIHTVDENAPLMIVPVTSYDHAFAGMLAWENTLNADLTPIFTSVPNLITSQSGIPSKRTFQDLVMRNYDVRALKDDGGEIQLYYSFPSQRMLVIAESPYSFTEILSRLQAGQKI